MPDIKRFLILDANGNVNEQTDSMSLEVEPATTGRGVVNLDQVYGMVTNAVADEASQRQFADQQLTDNLNSVSNQLQQEISDRFNADAQINARIDNLDSGNTASLQAEIARATAAEAALQAAIDAEAAARSLADGQLGDAITAEQQARATADTALGVRIDGVVSDLAAEALARQAADTAEATARAAQDTLLSGRIDDEVARATAAELALGVRVDTEISDRQAADLVLTNRIAAEETFRGSEITRVEGLISAEASTRAAADAALQAALTQEIADRQAADTAETTRAQTAEAALQAALAQEVSDRTAADLAEAAARSAADATLTTNLAAEVTRATGEEARIEAKFDAAVAAEAAARAAADATLTANLAAEVSRATAAEGSLRTDLNAEIGRATAAEDVLTAALAAEVARATAEEIAVETRAKAYADALKQGLKPKDSVDFSFTRYVPKFDSTALAAGQGFVPKYRLLVPIEVVWDNNGTTQVDHPVLDGEALPAVDPSGTPAQVITLSNASNGSTSYGVFIHGMRANGVSTFEYSANPYSFSLPGQWTMWQALQGFQNNTPGGAAQWFAYRDAGWEFYPLGVEVVDLADPATLEAYLQDFKTANPSSALDLTKPSTRIAIVQNGISGVRDEWLKEARETPSSFVKYNNNADSTTSWVSYFLNRADIEALPPANRFTASWDAFEATQNVGLGIYERKVVNGTATIARAADFQSGLEISGAFFVTEQPLMGPATAKSLGMNNWYTIQVHLDPQRLTGPNVILVASNVDQSKTSAVVGTDALRFTVFNRVGAYKFADGLWQPDPMDPTFIAVKGKNDYSTYTSDGVYVDAGTGPRANIEHQRNAPNDPHDPSTYLNLKGPLVGGMSSVIEAAELEIGYRNNAKSTDKALHAHSANYMQVEFWPITRDDNYNIVGGMATGRLVTMGSHAFGPPSGQTMRDTIVDASWDAPGYVGITDWREQFDDSANGLGYDAQTGYKGRVALAGTGRFDLGACSGPSLSSFAMNEMAYIGSNSGTLVKYSDIPSGKWAIPVGYKIGTSILKLVDRPATLKA